MPPLSPSFLKVDIRECLDQHFAILQTFGCQLGARVRGLLVTIVNVNQSENGIGDI